MLFLEKIIINYVMAERERWVLWVPFGIGTGVGCYFSLSVEPPLWIGGIGVLLTALVFYLGRQVNFVRTIASALLTIAIGFSAGQLRTWDVAHTVLQKRIGPISVSGRILFVEDFNNGPRVTVEKIQLAYLLPFEKPEKIRISLRGEQPLLAPGQWISVRAVLMPPPAPVMPGSFDFQRRFYFMEIGATGFAMGRARILQKPTGNTVQIPMATAIQLAIARLRHTITATIREIIPGATGGVAAALMTGDRSGIPEDVLEDFRQSGLAHLLAISGLHIGLLAGLLFAGLRMVFALIPILALRYPIKKWAAYSAILGAIRNKKIAGATIPSQRAFLMISLVLIAVIVDRQGISLRMVAWAAAIILVLRPESLLGASFQLSFAAVIALIAAYEVIHFRSNTSRQNGWLMRVTRYLGGVALTTIIATLATSPFALFHFNQMAQFGLLANIGAVPITALWVMPFAIMAFALMPLGWSEIGLMPMAAGIEIILESAATVSSWEGAILTVPAMPIGALILIAFGGLWLCLWRLKWRVFGGIPIAAGLASLFFVTPPDIIIESRGKLFAVQGKSGILQLSSQRVAKFTSETWLRRVGQQQGSSDGWPHQGPNNNKTLTCDRLGCIYLQKGHKIALITDSQAVAEDCQSADIVVSAVPVPWHCPSARLVIDWFDLWRHGAHAVWLSQGAVRVENVNNQRGDRPWVLRPRSKEVKKD